MITTADVGKFFKTRDGKLARLNAVEGSNLHVSIFAHKNGKLDYVEQKIISVNDKNGLVEK